MALLMKSIQTQEINAYNPERISRPQDDEVDINQVLKGWMSLYMEFDRENEIELRDESIMIIHGLIEMKNNVVLK